MSTLPIHPAHTIGGDFGLIRPLKEEYLNLLVCDVSGHGILRNDSAGCTIVTIERPSRDRLSTGP